MTATQAPHIYLPHYADTGCEMHPACLECPMEFCKSDDPSVNRAEQMWLRYQTIRELRAQGLTRRQIADRVGCSKTTVAVTLSGDMSAAIPRDSQSYPDNRDVLRRLKPASALFASPGPPRFLARGNGRR